MQACSHGLAHSEEAEAPARCAAWVMRYIASSPARPAFQLKVHFYSNQQFSCHHLVFNFTVMGSVLVSNAPQPNRHDSNAQPSGWSKEALLALVTLLVTVVFPCVGYISRRRFRNLCMLFRSQTRGQSSTPQPSPETNSFKKKTPKRI